MNLANFSTSTAEYANKNNYKIIEYFTDEHSTYPNIIKMLNKCFDKAREEGCVEVCIHEIKSEYSFHDEERTWHVSVFGFIPKKG